MNKKSEEEVKSEEAKTAFKTMLQIKEWCIRLIILGIFGYGAYWLYQNPSVWQKPLKQEELSAREETINAQIIQLQNQIAGLQAQLLNLPQPDLSEFENKVANLEKMNFNVIDSKADASIVLGMLTRVDKLENRLDKVTKISDDGALILSAAMLVKQAAEEGGSFVYEAELLNHLTPEQASIKKDVSVIAEYARNGIASKRELIRRFNTIYAAEQAPQSEKSADWKERLNHKINEYIQINKVGEKSQETEAYTPWVELAALIDDGRINKAVKLIESSDSDVIKQNQLLQEWLADARNMLIFNQVVRNIAAYSLAEMKVNNLKNKE